MLSDARRRFHNGSPRFNRHIFSFSLQTGCDFCEINLQTSVSHSLIQYKGLLAHSKDAEDLPCAGSLYFRNERSEQPIVELPGGFSPYFLISALIFDFRLVSRRDSASIQFEVIRSACIKVVGFPRISITCPVCRSRCVKGVPILL